MACHRLATGSAIFRCLDCHTEIAKRLSSHRGFHATVLGVVTTNKDCVRCHSEHNGESFPLIRWEPSRNAFDHLKTGYALEGKHAELSCQQCHNAKNVSETERPNIKIKDLNRTLLGLSRDCLSCHTDPHRGQLGENCLRCHTLNEWKKTEGFDHSKSKFPLTGAHIRLACAKCHKATNPDSKVPRYIGLAFDKCSACHGDPHRGTFKTGCDSCHTTSTWKQVQTAALGAQFDHSRTKFPLLGKHATVHCSTCHHGQDFGAPLAHGKCADCHRPDPHRGQFHARKDGGACESCHTVEGFKQTKFGVAEHAATSYPLEGKHTAVPCAKCHVPAGPDTVYRIKLTRCMDCHKDVHKGQFARAPHGIQCETCHTLKGFAPSSFTLARHNETHFPLTGGHVAVTCIDCHRVRKLPTTASPVPYRFDDLTCTGCHEDPHKGQFVERSRVIGQDGKQLGCEACHSTKAWLELARFDHSTTKFSLEGTHRAVPCISCHKPPSLGVTMRNVTFKSAPKNCAGCHEDVHANQFAQTVRAPGCRECHNTNKWKPSLFDHNKRTEFPLEGVHRDLRCSACHKRTRVVGDKVILFYKPTPRLCADCHGAS